MKKIFRNISLILLMTITFSACSKNNENNEIEIKKSEEEIAKLEEKRKKEEEEKRKELEVSNNKDYDWYMDQKNTGEYSRSNCGPTATAMVLKWLNPDSKETGLSLRNEVPNNGDWWNTNIILASLKQRGIHTRIVRYTEAILKNYVKNGYIALVCLDMRYISGSDRNPTKIGKRHNDKKVSGHFIIVKGYKHIDNELYFEVYDPDSWNFRDDKGQLVGKGRYYKASEMSNAINNWWKHIYVFK